VHEELKHLTHCENLGHIKESAIRSHFILVWICWVSLRERLITWSFTSTSSSYSRSWSLLSCSSWSRFFCQFRGHTFIRALTIWRSYSCRIFIWRCSSSFTTSKILEIGNILHSLKSTSAENLSEGHIHAWELICQFFSQSSMCSKIILCKSIFNICDQRMILNHLDIIFEHSFNIKLNFLTLLLVLVWILWVFVIAAISVATDSNLEYFSSFVIGT